MVILLTTLFITLIDVWQHEKLVVGASAEPLIVGGIDITIAEAPYSVIFEYNNNALCGAAIISENFALTSGNCVEGFTDDELNNAIRLRSGSTTQGRDGDIHKIANFTLHPKYNGIVNDYDVAIIEVVERFQFGENTDAVAIAGSHPLPPNNVTITGWGYTSPNGGGGDDLQRVDLTVIGRVACQTALMDYMDVTDRMFCGYTEFAGPCYRDFGNPVVTANKALVGVFSSIVGCARDSMPAVVTDINHPEIRTWIQSISGI